MEKHKEVDLIHHSLSSGDIEWIGGDSPKFRIKEGGDTVAEINDTDTSGPSLRFSAEEDFMVSPSYPTLQGEFDGPGDIYIKDITSLIGADPLVLQRMELYVAAREELGFTIDSIVEIDVQGYNPESSLWEFITLGGIVVNTSITYPDYGGGSAQDARALFEEHDLVRDIVIIPDPKFTQYRLLVRNESQDDKYGVGRIYFKRLLNKSVINKASTSFRDVNVLKNLKIYNGAETDTYIQFVMRKSSYTNSRAVKVYMQSIIEGQFAGEKLIE
ncbi:MAG TPA: hypothetical protein DD671_17275, partial [Balneolaceae bacterium]|nr:hypothetical protein [Balneolaceae bacterium]